MDGLTRISYYFPTGTLTVFQIISNLVINDVGDCAEQERQLMIALVVIFSLICFMVSFTDTYTAYNGLKFWVVLVPFHGPICVSLPTDEDKERVFEYFNVKLRDIVHAFLSMLVFILISLFTNPVCMCIFPSGLADGTSRFDPSIRCSWSASAPPRQMLGYQNVPDTAAMTFAMDNPMYANEGGSFRNRRDQFQNQNPDAIQEGDEEEGMDAPPPARRGLDRDRNGGGGSGGGGGGGHSHNSNGGYTSGGGGHNGGWRWCGEREPWVAGGQDGVSELGDGAAEAGRNPGQGGHAGSGWSEAAAAAAAG
ncbi:MAG: hypothetical protein WDW36_006116 [Sanguina aurantia]